MLAAKNMLQANSVIDKVRRNLFGEVDHEQLKKDFETNMSDDLEKAKLKWNFDFKKEIPLKGNYEWVRVEDPLLETTAQEVLEEPLLETTTQERVEESQQEVATQERVEESQQEVTTQERVEESQQEVTTQERVEESQREVATQERVEESRREVATQERVGDSQQEVATQERVGDSQQEVATQDGDTTSYPVHCKRKQSLMTDYFSVKRRCSSSSSQCSP